MDQKFGETGEKKGFLSKVKDKLLPAGPGEIEKSVSFFLDEGGGKWRGLMFVYI